MRKHKNKPPPITGKGFFPRAMKIIAPLTVVIEIIQSTVLFKKPPNRQVAHPHTQLPLLLQTIVTWPPGEMYRKKFFTESFFVRAFSLNSSTKGKPFMIELLEVRSGSR
jgi:hypothetical protein